jgi:hypothetical protein
MFVIRPPVAAWAAASEREPSGAAASVSGGIQAMRAMIAHHVGGGVPPRCGGTPDRPILPFPPERSLHRSSA